MIIHDTAASDYKSINVADRVLEARFYGSGVTKPVQCEALADFWSLASLCCMFCINSATTMLYVGHSGQQLNLLLSLLIMYCYDIINWVN